MGAKYSYRFSVFTATYNRAQMLLRLYNELKDQTFKDFEWVIVNDGSTDDTDDVVSNIINDNILNVQYVSKKNGGKHTAWAAALEKFKGQYVVTADDDDPITPDMLAIFEREWTKLEKSAEYAKFWEIKSRCKDFNGKLVGDALPTPYFDSDYNTVSYKLKVFCEMVGCRKVEVLRNEASVPSKFMFMDNATNFDESIRWSRAARKYKTRFIPDITRIYMDTPNSLCSNTLKRCLNGEKRILANKMVEFYYTLKEKSDLLLKWDKKRYIRTILGFSLLITKCNIPLNDIPLNKRNKAMMSCLKPISLLYLYYKTRR